MYTATNAARIRARESWRASREPATDVIRDASTRQWIGLPRIVEWCVVGKMCQLL